MHFFLPGKFVFSKIIDHDFSAFSVSFQTLTNVYFGTNKKVDVIGSGRSTKIYIDQTLTTKRDSSVVCFPNQTLISSMVIKFKLKPSEKNYSIPIFWFSAATFTNVYFKNLTQTKISYAYNNNSNDLIVKNCEFNIGNAIFPNHSSSPKYENCIFSVLPVNGAVTNCIIAGSSDFLKPD